VVGRRGVWPWDPARAVASGEMSEAGGVVSNSSSKAGGYDHKRAVMRLYLGTWCVQCVH
jgi:hypothetical protein